MTLHVMPRRAALAGILLALAAAVSAQPEPNRTGGPYVPTPQVVVDQMLRIGNIGPDDFVIDLGSGDGVIVLTAARTRKARGMGVEIDPALVKLSNAEAKRLGIADRAEFVVQDVFKTDLSRATVVTLYLLPGMMLNLRPKIYNELRPGTRVVSHDYHFDDWRPDDSYTWDVPEKEKINGVPSATVHLWIVPAKIGGRWRVEVEGGEAFEATIRQNFQVIDGTAVIGSATAKFAQTSLRGEEIAFSLTAGGGRQTYRGRASGGAMQGTVDLGGGRSAKWTAKRIGA